MFKLIPITIVGLSLIISGCGPRAFTKGQYDDPNKVILLDDKFSENDMQLISNTLVESLSKADVVTSAKSKPIVMVGTVKNSTSEHINVKAMTDKIRTSLIKSGKFKFSDKEARAELDQEYDYQSGKNVNQQTAKKRGKQVGADFIITGDVASNIQEVGSDKVVYYIVTLNLIDTETNLIEWSENREVRKRYKKRSVGF